MKQKESGTETESPQTSDIDARTKTFPATPWWKRLHIPVKENKTTKEHVSFKRLCF